MSYFILRNGLQYGPYSRADVQRYLRTGDLYPGDLSRTEEMKQWLPVTRVLGTAAPPPPSTGAGLNSKRAVPRAMPVVAGETATAAMPGATVRLPPPPAMALPLPPAMRWEVLALLIVMTGGVFAWVWGLAVARWVREIDPRNRAIPVLAASFVLNIATVVLMYIGRAGTSAAIVAVLLELVGIALFVSAMIVMRRSIVTFYNTSENVALSMSTIMTFFFHVIYFQFKFNRAWNVRPVSTP
jgi:hypothetical protein